MSSKEDIVRKEVRSVLREYEERPVVEFVGLDEGRLAFKIVEGQLDQGSPRQLVSELENKAGLSFISAAKRNGQTIYVTVDGRTGPGKLRNVMNTQFRV